MQRRKVCTGYRRRSYCLRGLDKTGEVCHWDGTHCSHQKRNTAKKNKSRKKTSTIKKTKTKKTVKAKTKKKVKAKTKKKVKKTTNAHPKQEEERTRSPSLPRSDMYYCVDPYGPDDDIRTRVSSCKMGHRSHPHHPNAFSNLQGCVDRCKNW